jgi:hypothetical protein
VAVWTKGDGVVHCVFGAISETGFVMNLKIRCTVGSTNKRCRFFASLADAIGT